jgi:tungstate transport system permease protein
MVIAQLVIALPIVAAVSAAAVSAVPRELRLQARSLGASPLQEAFMTLKEARMGLIAAVAAGFGSIISEVGAVTMVGGNLAGKTRVMTTAIVQYTRMGDYGPALALAAVLMGMVLIVNILLARVQSSAERYEA